MASALDHLEKTFSELYRKEIDQEENVWRTLPFFAATIALQFGMIAGLLPKIGAPEPGFAQDAVLNGDGKSLCSGHQPQPPHQPNRCHPAKIRRVVHPPINDDHAVFVHQGHANSIAMKHIDDPDESTAGRTIKVRDKTTGEIVEIPIPEFPPMRVVTKGLFRTTEELVSLEELQRRNRAGRV